MCFSDEYYHIWAKYTSLNLTCSFRTWTQGGWCSGSYISVSARYDSAHFWWCKAFYSLLCVRVRVCVCVSMFSPLRHLQARHLGWLVSISPGDFGRLSAVGRDGVSNDDGVVWGNHSAVSCHGDGCQYVVTCNVNTATVFTLSHLWLTAMIRLISPFQPRLLEVAKNGMQAW